MVRGVTVLRFPIAFYFHSLCPHHNNHACHPSTQWGLESPHCMDIKFSQSIVALEAFSSALLGASYASGTLTISWYATSFAFELYFSFLCQNTLLRAVFNYSSVFRKVYGSCIAFKLNPKRTIRLHLFRPFSFIF